MRDQPTTVRRGPPDDLWRVDVAGYSCNVKGEHARDHLQAINRQLARMKLALHKIAKGDNQNPEALIILARRGLNEGGSSW